MADRPVARRVECPECEEEAYAVIPKRATSVDAEADADGKVWATCRDCDARFLVHYAIES